jgi:hypothetical protein
MDRTIKLELERLSRCFEDALADIRLASNDEDLLAAWRTVQTAAWELNAVLPTALHHSLP